MKSHPLVPEANEPKQPKFSDVTGQRGSKLRIKVGFESTHSGACRAQVRPKARQPAQACVIEQPAGVQPGAGPLPEHQGPEHFATPWSVSASRQWEEVTQEGSKTPVTLAGKEARGQSEGRAVRS